jgi:hypothetical protein
MYYYVHVYFTTGVLEWHYENVYGSRELAVNASLQSCIEKLKLVSIAC